MRTSRSPADMDAAAAMGQTWSSLQGMPEPADSRLVREGLQEEGMLEQRNCLSRVLQAEGIAGQDLEVGACLEYSWNSRRR